MAVVVPNNEQPIKTVLVEVGDKGQEEEAMDMGDICDGSSTTSSSNDMLNDGGRGDRGTDRGEGGGKFGECRLRPLSPGMEEREVGGERVTEEGGVVACHVAVRKARSLLAEVMLCYACMLRLVWMSL